MHSSGNGRGVGSEILELLSGGSGWFPFFFLQAPTENAFFIGSGTLPSRKYVLAGRLVLLCGLKELAFISVFLVYGCN